MSTTELHRELLQIAVDLAHRAGDLAAAGRATGTIEVSTKSTLTDMVTEYDRAAEALIVDALATSRPGDGIVGEEGSSKPSATGISWIIDPIDGTTNFLYDLPGWAVSIAAADEHGPLAAAVYAPALATTFTATRGDGAFRNGQPISASSLTSTSTALVATGFSYRVDRRVWQSRWVHNLLPHVRDLRRMGAASVDLCNVACGRVDAYIEDGLGPWDLAASHLIAIEAGAVATDWEGGPISPNRVFVSAPGIAVELRDLVRDAMQRAGDRPD